jgi:hypothetical protein
MRKTTFLTLKQSFELFLKIPKVSNKTQNLRPFEGFSLVFRLILCFWNMSEVVYEKKVCFCFLM